MTVTLDVTKREKGTEQPAGTIPGVVYGPKQEPISLAVDARVFTKTLDESGESTIITLKGLGDDIEVLVHDVAFNAARGGVEHVDFYAIERGKELTTNVPLEFIGESPVEKTGATVNRIMHDIEVTCRPSVLPSHIDVDISILVDEHAQIHISDLNIPKDVTVNHDAEDVVVNVAAAREIEAEEPTEAVDMDAIEVEAKGKEDGEEATTPSGEEKPE